MANRAVVIVRMGLGDYRRCMSDDDGDDDPREGLQRIREKQLEERRRERELEEERRKRGD